MTSVSLNPGPEMRLHLPGLMRETLPSGNVRWRVRPAGDKTRKITITVGPGDPDFNRQYDAARRGEKPEVIAAPTHIPRSVAWLVDGFDRAMQAKVAAGHLADTTRKQRMAFLARVAGKYGDKHMSMPRSAVIEHRDSLQATPGAADNAVKSIRAMYAWATERGLVRENPALEIPKLNRGTGAVPWSVDDLRQFREHHPQGTMAHLALTLFMFTACRVSDVYRLGRAHERRREGQLWLDWQPIKKGSAPVSVPVLPPLERAIAAQKVVGATYLLNGWGRPFASAAAFGNWFRDRVKEAELENRSPHGIRKAAGELLALEGATQYEIMCLHGHTQAKTSEVYTAGVNRQKLAGLAMEKLSRMEW